MIGPDGITDRAIYGAPRMQATGIDAGIVNGIIAWYKGEATKDARPGLLITD